MTPGKRRQDEAGPARIARLEQDVDDLREMLERLVAESLTAQEMVVMTGQGLPRPGGR